MWGNEAVDAVPRPAERLEERFPRWPREARPRPGRDTSRPVVPPWLAAIRPGAGPEPADEPDRPDTPPPDARFVSEWAFR